MKKHWLRFVYNIIFTHILTEYCLKHELFIIFKSYELLTCGRIYFNLIVQFYNFSKKYSRTSVVVYLKVLNRNSLVVDI